MWSVAFVPLVTTEPPSNAIVGSVPPLVAAVVADATDGATAARATVATVGAPAANILIFMCCPLVPQDEPPLRQPPRRPYLRKVTLRGRRQPLPRRFFPRAISVASASSRCSHAPRSPATHRSTGSMPDGLRL